MAPVANPNENGARKFAQSIVHPAGRAFVVGRIAFGDALETFGRTHQTRRECVVCPLFPVALLDQTNPLQEDASQQNALNIPARRSVGVTLFGSCQLRCPQY